MQPIMSSASDRAVVNIADADSDDEKDDALAKDPKLKAMLEEACKPSATAPRGAKIFRPGIDNPNAFGANHSENPDQVQEQICHLENMKREMDAAARLAKAEETKAQANEHFKCERWKVALRGYLTFFC